MHTRDRTESTITLLIPVVLYTLPLAMVETGRKWLFYMQMSRGTAPDHLIRQTAIWVDFVPLTSHQVQQPESSVGIDNLIIVHTEKVALAMEFWR